jgi:ribosomal-protein-alanine N-acetyltransferase
MDKEMIEPFPLLETPRLTLRDFQPGDVMQVFNIRSDERVMEYMDRPSMQSLEEAEKIVNSTIQGNRNKTSATWAITLKGEDILIGYASFWRWMKEHFRAEIGYALLPVYWGRGIIGEALTAVLKFGFKEMGLHSIEANVNPGNAASIKVLEKLKFKKEAYFRENMFFNGKFCDSVIYSLLETDRNEES